MGCWKERPKTSATDDRAQLGRGDDARAVPNIERRLPRRPKQFSERAPVRRRRRQADGDVVSASRDGEAVPQTVGPLARRREAAGHHDDNLSLLIVTRLSARHRRTNERRRLDARLARRVLAKNVDDPQVI